MQKKTKVMVLVLLILVAGGGALFWYVSSKSSSSTRTDSKTIEGTLQKVDCTRAGVGCAEWVLKLDNGETQGLAASQDIQTYVNKEVRLTGKYVESFGPSGPSFFEVQSVVIAE